MTHALVTMLLEEGFAEGVIEGIEEFIQGWRGIVEVEGTGDAMEGAAEVIKVPFGVKNAVSVAFGARQLILPYWSSTIESASSTPPVISTRLQVGDASLAHCL